jgi:hypothetical protein
MELDRNAPAFAEHQIFIQASPSDIWKIITNVKGWPHWNSLVAKSRQDRDFQAGAVFKWRSGGITITSTLTEVTLHKRIMWWGSAIGTKAIHLWEFEAKDSGTVVKTAETLDGWLVRLMKGAFQKTLNQALQTWLRDLKSEAEKKK